MINIHTHPIWKNISPIKRQGHLLRIFIAQKYAFLYKRDKFIGITGSVGKTTTAMVCKEVLSQKFKTISTSDNKIGSNLDPIFNIPITILKMTPQIKRVILEMSVEYPGEMEFYLSVVRPATAIVTGVFYQHSEFLGDIPEIASEKGKLVEQLPKDGVAILNWDNLVSRKMGEKTLASVVYFGTDSKNCHIWVGNVKIENFRTVFELNYGVERVEIRSNLLGKHQIYPLLAGAALGIAEDISLMKIKMALEKVQSLPHRMVVLEGFNHSTIIDDTYNAAPQALEEAIETLKYIPARRRIVVLGEMRELGKFSEKMHRGIAQKIFSEKIDLVLMGQGDTKYINDELLSLGFIEDRLFSDLSNSQIVSKLLKILSKGDLCLIKGAHGVRLDEVVARIAKSKKVSI